MEQSVGAKEWGNISSSLEFVVKQNLKSNAKILDIGCNLGSLIYKLHQHGWKNVSGIDNNKGFIKKGRKNYPLIRDRLIFYGGKELPYSDNSFDAILMFDVIEHIPDVSSFLKEQVYRCLKPSGVLVFQTPNKYPNILWEIINHRHLTYWKSYHCSLQTSASLFRILHEANFSNIEITKHKIVTDYNVNKVRKKIGIMGPYLLRIADTLPLQLTTNLWGVAHKP